MFEQRSDIPIDLQEHRSWTARRAMVRDISFTSTVSGRIPAYLVSPLTQGVCAGAILQHGMPGSRERLLAYAVDLAPTGLVSLLIDAPFVRRGRARPGSAPIRFTEEDYDEQVQTLIDLRRGIDLLVAYPQVDPERLAYGGQSYGAVVGGVLAGIERRVKLFILACGDGGIVRHFAGASPHAEPFRQLPHEHQVRWTTRMEPLEATNFVGKAAPATLYFQGARHDLIVAPAETAAYYAAASAPKHIDWYDAGHTLNQQALHDQVASLEAHVGIAREHFQLSFDPATVARKRAQDISDGDVQQLMRALREEFGSDGT